MFSKTSKIDLDKTLPVLASRNQIQTLKASGNQPRAGNQSPNTIATTGTFTIPGHVQDVRAVATKSSDVSTKVTVTFSRNPNDYQFVDARIFVSGYKGNPAPVQVGAGQSPVSFSLENTGEPVTVSVQSSGNLGQAPLSTAPSTTMQLVKTPLATTPTPSGNGTGGTTTVFKTNNVTNSSQTVLNLQSTDQTLYLTESAGTVEIFHRMFVTSFLYPQFAPNSGNYVESPVNSLSFASGGIGSPTITTVAATASIPLYLKHTTPASTGNAVTIYATGTRLQPHMAKSFKQNLLIFDTTSTRNWFGISDDSLPQGGAWQTDTPNKNFIGFRFSTNASDTHWQAVCQTDNTHQTLADTGITPDTSAFHIYEIRCAQGSPGTFFFYIDHSLVATISTNVPTSTTLMNPLVYVETRTTAARSVGVTVLSYERFF